MQRSLATTAMGEVVERLQGEPTRVAGHLTNTDNWRLKTCWRV